MRFAYKRFAKDIIRPIIPIKVSYRNNSLIYSVLVDSGADISVFDPQIARILDIPLASGKRQAVSGITGSSDAIFLHQITIGVGGYQFTSSVGFLRNHTSVGYGVVGQHGFFDKFEIKFDLRKEIIDLKPIIH